MNPKEWEASIENLAKELGADFENTYSGLTIRVPFSETYPFPFLRNFKTGFFFDIQFNRIILSAGNGQKQSPFNFKEGTLEQLTELVSTNYSRLKAAQENAWKDSGELRKEFEDNARILETAKKRFEDLNRAGLNLVMKEFTGFLN